jgi:hypothetical protein
MYPVVEYDQQQLNYGGLFPRPVLRRLVAARQLGHTLQTSEPARGSCPLTQHALYVQQQQLDHKKAVQQAYHH